MGQSIDVADPVVLDDVAIFATDRSLSGQDGESYASSVAAEAGHTFPADLAARLFAADPAITNVFVFSNDASIRRAGGWTPENLADAAAVIRDFFVVYDDNKGA